jgi:hypothetical protein
MIIDLIQYLFWFCSYAITYILAAISAVEAIDYKENSFVNYKEILSSLFQPSISIIAPATMKN